MLHTDESGVTEDPSSAFKRSYSSASESSMMSPSNSVDSMRLRKGFGSVTSPNSSMDSQKGFGVVSPNSSMDSMPLRKGLEEASLVSMDSLSCENQTTVYPDTLDPEESLCRSRNSYTSSELSDSISSGMLRRDIQLASALSTVPEHPTAQIQSGMFIEANHMVIVIV